MHEKVTKRQTHKEMRRDHHNWYTMWLWLQSLGWPPDNQEKTLMTGAPRHRDALLAVDELRHEAADFGLGDQLRLVVELVRDGLRVVDQHHEQLQVPMLLSHAIQLLLQGLGELPGLHQAPLKASESR